jgi:uncharacterized sulfatase
MRRLGKVALSVFAVVAVLGGLAWWQRAEIVLTVVEVLASRTVSPNVPIAWDSGADPAGRAPDERPPNIVLILADDLGWNDVTFGGGGVAGGSVPTPNIDSIAAEGVHFTNGYAANATCAPSRAALMSGRYGTRFGFEFTPTPGAMMPVLGMISEERPLRPALPNREALAVPYEQMGMPASEITIAELLKEQGYHTAHIGKWHLGRTNGMAPEDQGFDESLLMASGLYLPEDHPDAVNARPDRPLPVARLELRGVLQRRRVVRARGLPHGLLHGRGRQGDRCEQGPAVLPLPGPLGAPHPAPGDEGRL